MVRVVFDRPIAHRGLHDSTAGIIENSRSAFEAAIGGGYAIECDLQLSSDGVPFVFHDDDFGRLTATSGRSDARPIAEVQSLVLAGSATGDRPQRFEEFLAQVAGRTQLQIELKQQASAARTRALAEAVVSALSAYAGPCTFESFDPYLLLALRRVGVAVPLGIVTYGYDEPASHGSLPLWKRLVARHLLHWPLTRFDFISCHDKALDLPAVRLFRALGMTVTSWTISTPEAARRALKRADQIVFEGFTPARA